MPEPRRVPLPTDGFTETQSYSIALREAIFRKICALPFFDGFTARRTRQFPIQNYHLPYIGVYIIDEQITPDGDYNIGCLAFIHALKLGFSVQFEDNDPDILELKLDAAFWALMNGLLRDQYLFNFLDTYDPHAGLDNPDNTRTEGLTRGMRRHNWGAPRSNNETPWAELQTEMTLQYRTYWPPILDDDRFLRMGITTIPWHHGRIPPAEEVHRTFHLFEFDGGKSHADDSGTSNRGEDEADRRPDPAHAARPGDAARRHHPKVHRTP